MKFDPAFKKGVGAATFAFICATALSSGVARAAEPQRSDAKAKSDTATATGAIELEEIVVTGSRIRRAANDTPAPVMAISAEQIRSAGHTEVADVINQLPAVAITQSNQTSNLQGNAGVNALDLRGLGVNRTLVLVDGRRQAPAIPGTSAVDISNIPSALVERVEILTGGASSIYGADAVSGVANFILKKKYEGVDANIRYGNSSRGDIENYDLDVLAGKNFNEDRGNVTFFAYRGAQTDTVSGQNRPWTGGGFPLYDRPNTKVPYTILDNQHNIFASPSAQVLLGGKLWSFNPNGTLREPRLGPSNLTNPTKPDLKDQRVLGGLRTDGGEYGGRYDSWYLSVPSRRTGLRTSVDYEFAEALKLFGSVQYSHNSARSAGAALVAYGGDGDVVPADSPYITDEMRKANGGSISDPVRFARKFDELGSAITEYDREFVQTNIGAQGDYHIFSKDWNYSAYYSYGKTKEHDRQVNNIAMNRYYDALDSTKASNGKPACRSTLNDPTHLCVPINPFMPLTSQMVSFLRYTSDRNTQTLDQQVASAYTSGDLFSLPAGNVKMVIGAEYREESNNIGAIPQLDPDSPSFDETIGSSAHPLVGTYNVREVFGETHIPILSDLPMAKTLDFDAAIRYSRYSTSGTTTTWNLGGEWAPTQDVRFRSTLSQAVRAPNINEIFTSQSSVQTWISDPCNTWNIANRVDKTQYTSANCARINLKDKNTFWILRPVVTEGNPDLQPETAKTLTVGAVITPRFLRNFSLSVDYFKIDLRDSIDSFPAQTLINRCVDAPTLSNMFCSLIPRGSDGSITEVKNRRVNIAQYMTRGVDIELLYQFDLDDLGWKQGLGSISLDAAYSRTLDKNYTLDPASPSNVTRFAGVFGTPRWKGVVRTSYNGDGLGLTWNLRHYSPMKASTTINEDQYKEVWTPNVFYSDFTGWYRLRNDLDIYAGVMNAFDKAPPRIPGAEAGGANFEVGYQAGVYDVIGRTFHIGLHYQWH